MEVKENHITFEKSGRFFTYGNPEKASHLLVALHGYGQLANYFIRKFNVLNPDKYFIVCPEGLHRFYKTGTNGRVGASWMTKEDRFADIKDYVSFLDELNDDLTRQHTFEQRTLLGFSQGGATASRWIGYGSCSFDTFLLWAAVFPPDMGTSVKTKFNTLKNYFVIGSKDEYTSMDQAKTYHNSLNSDGMNFEFVKFEGNHSIDIKLLQNLIK